MEMRTALLVGATGLTGGHCLKLLLNDKAYDKVTVLTRRPLPITHEKLKQHIVDFNNLDESSELIKADDLFCCLGTTIKIAGSKEAFRKVDFEYPAALARLACANDCKRFLVVSAPEANSKSPLFYSRVKAEMEHAISGFAFEEGVYIFRPSLLVGERDESRFAEDLAIKIFTAMPFLLSGPMKKLRPIEAKTVASAMVSVAKSELVGQQSFSSDIIQAIHDNDDLVTLI